MKPKNFSARYITLLEKASKEDPNLEEVNFDPVVDEAAAKATLDDPSTMAALKTKMDSNTVVVDETEAKQHAETVTMKEKLEEWVDVLGAFIEFINGNDDHSMQKLLAKAPAESLFNKIKISEGKKISRTATDLAQLKEALNGYIVSN